MNKIKITTYMFFLCTALLFTSCTKANGTKMYLEAKTQEQESRPAAEQPAGSTDAADRSGSGQADTDSKTSGQADTDFADQTCFVYVCGAVKHPGVFELPQNSRVYEAIALAGGFRKNAYEKGINQAAQITDGQMIEVLTVKEQKESGAKTQGQGTDAANAQSQDDRIDINTATAEQLTTLSGIGQAKAENIIAYRESSGGFSSVEDLMKVSGIGEGVYERIKDKVKVTH